jgi:hypothetical protein
MNDIHDEGGHAQAHGLGRPPVTAGGGAHDVTGPEAADDVAAPPHGADAVAHGEAEDQPLGPIDWAAWRAAAVGVAIAALICVLLYLAIAA